LGSAFSAHLLSSSALSYLLFECFLTKGEEKPNGQWLTSSTPDHLTLNKEFREM